MHSEIVESLVFIDIGGDLFRSRGLELIIFSSATYEFLLYNCFATFLFVLLNHFTGLKVEGGYCAVVLS